MGASYGNDRAEVRGARGLPLLLVLGVTVIVAVGSASSQSDAAGPTPARSVHGSTFDCGAAQEMLAYSLTYDAAVRLGKSTPDEAARALIEERAIQVVPSPTSSSYRDEAGQPTARSSRHVAEYRTSGRAGVTLEVVTQRINSGWHAVGYLGCMDVLGATFVEEVDR